MSIDLIRTQLFFKDLLAERISNPSKNNEYSNPFSLDLFDYDLYNEDIQKITNLIILSDKFTTLKIRLSHTLTDDNILSKLLRKISLKRQFKTLSFYIKNLHENLLNIFLDFIGKMQESVITLKLKLKFDDEKEQKNIAEKILENLEKSGGVLENIYLENFDLSSKNNMELLEKYLLKNKNLKNLCINKCSIYEHNFNIDISNIKTVKINNCDIIYINYLPLENLNLSGNNINKDGIKKLVELITDEKCTLMKLNLSNNLLGDDSISILSQGISKNKSLISINLSSNKIINSGLIEFSKNIKSETGNSTITKINFSKNEIENTALIEFCNILKTEKKGRFSKIDFSYNNLTDRAIIDFGEFLQNHPTLLKLNINNEMTEENISNFFNLCKSLDQLKKINLENIGVCDANTPHLNDIFLSNKNIQSINLSNNKHLNHQGILNLISGIEHNIKLLSINLSYCNIEDEGAKNLANSLFKNLEIKEIFLPDNKIGEKGVKFLAEKLLGKTSLKILDLSFNKINSKGGLYIGKGLIDAQGIQRLLLGYNKIEDEGCEFIAEGLEKNASLIELNLENNNISNKGINAICKYLKKNENLMHIELNGNKITEIDSDFYELFNWLKDIKISENPLNQSGVVRLFQGSEYNRLFKSLKFRYNNSEEDYHFKCFNENIKNIDISFNRNINVSLMKHILSLKNLSKLNLQMNNITDDNIKSIVNYIKDCNTPIKNLILKNNKITSKGSIYISELINHSKTLKKLDLSFNDLRSEGIKTLCEALISNDNNIKELYLNGNKCNDYCSQDIFNILTQSNSKNLKILSLSNNCFTNKGFDKILSSLRKNDSLVHLSLNENKIDTKAFINLANYLKFNKTLKILEIKNSRITDESLKKIAKALGDNYSLKNLNLCENNLEFESMAKFGLYTCKNYELDEIKVMNNKMLKEQQNLLICCNSHLIFAN